MPLIRESCWQSVNMWNTHSIRKQKDRPNSIPGKLLWNYKFNSRTKHYHQEIDEQLVDDILEDIIEFGKWSYIIPKHRTTR